MTKKTQTPTPLDLAATKVTSIEQTISQEEKDLQPLQAEQTRLLAKEVHSFAETDRLAEVTKELERREDHLNHLRHVALADAVALQRRLELLALAEDGAQGIVGKHEEMERRVAEAERKVAEGLAEDRAAVEDWNSFLQPLLAVAEEAGQDSRNPADPDHPVTVVIDSMRPYRPLYLEIDG